MDRVDANLAKFPFGSKYEVISDFEPLFGGQSSVHKAIGVKNSREYAVKVMPIQNETQKTIVLKEIEVLTNNRHRYIVELMDYEIIDNQCFLILPWMSENILQSISQNKKNENDNHSVVQPNDTSGRV